MTKGAQYPENSEDDVVMRPLRRVNAPVPSCEHSSSEWVGVAAAKIREQAF